LRKSFIHSVLTSAKKVRWTRKYADRRRAFPLLLLLQQIDDVYCALQSLSEKNRLKLALVKDILIGLVRIHYDKQS
jgi:hypothetical protein